MELTREEVDALEVSIRLQLGNIAKSRQLTESVLVHGPTVLSLIAAAKELGALRSALAHLSDCNFCLDSPDYRSTLDPGDIVESALMNGWEPVNGH